MPAALYVRPLSEHEQLALHQQYRTTHDAELRSRTQRVLLSATGHPVAQIASLTFLGEDTVLCSTAMTKTSSTVLPPALALGGHPKVDDDYRQTLQMTIETAPRERGHAFSTWDCRDLTTYLEQHGYPAVHDETVRRHLRALGYRVIRPVVTISSPDPA